MKSEKLSYITLQRPYVYSSVIELYGTGHLPEKYYINISSDCNQDSFVWIRLSFENVIYLKKGNWFDIQNKKYFLAMPGKLVFMILPVDISFTGLFILVENIEKLLSSTPIHHSIKPMNHLITNTIDSSRQWNYVIAIKSSITYANISPSTWIEIRLILQIFRKTINGEHVNQLHNLITNGHTILAKYWTR